MTATALKFDEMEYDTTLAKDFLKQHIKFVGFNCENNENITVINRIGKEICLGNPSEVTINDEDVEVKKKKLWNLSQLIQENIQLFCQLEYMIRGIKPEESRDFDLKLITQNLLYCSSKQHQPVNLDLVDSIYMKNNSPLVRLARFAEKILETNKRITIVAEKDIAIVCWLFVHHCEKAGFENQVALYFVEDVPSYEPEYLLEVHEPNAGGCIAVVTGKADFDSAVDALVEAPHRVPWGIRRVLVQENVLERFRTALQGKARVCPGEVDGNLSLRSTSAFAIGEKTFLVEYAGEALGDEAILVEGYRTVKELLSLLSRFSPYALSVWCDSASEANEIAHSTTTDIVWVNTYGELDGPPQVSKVLLSRIQKGISVSTPDEFKRACSAWQKLAQWKRAAKLRDLVNEHGVTNADGSFYYVGDRFTCAGTERPAGTLVVLTSQRYSTLQLLTHALKGGSIVCEASNGLCDALKNAGAPVCEIREGRSATKTVDSVAHVDMAANQKLIWTSYGTTFAN